MNAQRFLLKLVKRLPTSAVQRLAGRPLEIDGYRLNPHLQLLANGAARRQPPLDDLAKYRRVTQQAFRLLNAPRRPRVRVTDSALTGPPGGLAMRLYEPHGASDPSPAILYFHQGGLVLFDLDVGDTFCTVLADECQARVLSLDYRRCPEHPFPAAIDDAMLLWQDVQARASELQIDPARVALAGDSAGGLIASVLCQQLQAAGGPQPAAQCLVYPWVATDIQPTGSTNSCADTFPLSRTVMAYFMQQVLPGGRGVDSPLVNPLLAADVSGLPPAVIATAGFDPLRDQGNAYADKLTAAGVPVIHHCFGSLCHGFLAMGNVTVEAERASQQIARDLATFL